MIALCLLIVAGVSAHGQREPLPTEVQPDGNRIQAQTWRMSELKFKAVRDYSEGGAEKVLMDVTFKHRKSGETIVRPAFWDGDNVFLVRFAPTRKGIWVWESTCREDKTLDGLNGKLVCRKYDGDLAVYRHGFVKATPGRKYMTYSDGTPFFYLGDTHWGMYSEEIDEAGPHAGGIRTDSHFKYIVDRRAEQGFTVYQSEPIGARFRITDGKVDQEDIEGFRLADRYYKHIADAGLVHANAEFFFAGEMSKELAFDNERLESLSRYWVARFGAFPVMWTLAQEVDNDNYSERGDQRIYDFSNNPWVRVAEYIHRYDAYSHPLSAHQENALYTTVTGLGVDVRGLGADNNGASAFASEEVARRCGHNWWAVQWSPSLTSSPDPAIVRDYWNSSRPAVNYEGRYCYLWTKDFGSRVQGWVSFLTGFCGYGYGAIDMWLYKSTYDINRVSDDGVDTITVEDKARPWSDALNFPSAAQMGHLRSFLEAFDWWNLTPGLAGEDGFEPQARAFAHAKTSDRHVLFFYSKETATGVLTGLAPDRKHELEWYNPRTGETGKRLESKSGADGRLILPERPDNQDWVLTVFE